MARKLREKSSSNIYHVILRGINHQRIFENNEDYNKFLAILKEYRVKLNFSLCAWCLMPNHIHLLIKEKTKNINEIMQPLEVNFVGWYNNKYDRVGPLFDGRFKSEPVQDEYYFYKVIRYIHMNPVKAGICKGPEEYRYNSYNDYFKSGKYADDDLIFHMIRKDEFEKFHQEPNDDECLETSETTVKRKTDEEICRFAENQLGIKRLIDVQAMSKKDRTSVILSLFEFGASIRQINRLTGVSITIVREIQQMYMQMNC